MQATSGGNTMATDPTTDPDAPVADTAPAAHEPPDVASHVAGDLGATSLQASLSVIGSAHAEDFEAVGSVVGFTSAGRDATITASAAPIVHAKGDIQIRQAYTSAVIAGGDMEISQAFSPIIVGKQLLVQQGGACVAISGEAEINNGFVGVLLSPKANISEDSSVLLSTKAAIIIAAALLGGLALVAMVMSLGVRRVMRWRPEIHVPPVPDFGAIAGHFRRHDAA
jgi:hypothetical protein